MSTIPNNSNKKVFRKSKSDPDPQLYYSIEVDPSLVLDYIAEDCFGSCEETPIQRTPPLRPRSLIEASPRTGSSSLYSFVLKNTHAKSPAAREMMISPESSFGGNSQAAIRSNASNNRAGANGKPSAGYRAQRRNSYPNTNVSSRRSENKPGAVLRPSLFAQYRVEKSIDSMNSIDQSLSDANDSRDESTIETVDCNEGMFKSFSIQEFTRRLSVKSEGDVY